MLQQLKHDTLKSRLVWIIIVLAAGVGLLAYSFTALLHLIQGPIPLEELTYERLEGAYVEGEVDLLIDWYVETVESKSGQRDRTIRREYLMPVYHDGSFVAVIGVEVPAELLSDAEAVVEETYRWLSDTDGSFQWDGSLLRVKGSIQHMDKKSQGYFYEVLSYYFDDVDKESCPPLVLRHGAVGRLAPRMQYLFLGGAAALLLLGVISLLVTLAGSAQKDIKAYVAAVGPDPESTWQELDEFYQSVPTQDGLKLDRKWMMYDKGAGSFLLKADDIAWVYHTVTTHRTNGIPTGKTHTVTVCSVSEKAGKARHNIPVKNEAKAEEMMRTLFGFYPGACYGYSADKDRAYRQDPAGFLRDLQAARRAAEEAAARAAAEKAEAEAAARAAEAAAAQPETAADEPAPATVE